MASRERRLRLGRLIPSGQREQSARADIASNLEDNTPLLVVIVQCPWTAGTIVSPAPLSGAKICARSAPHAWTNNQLGVAAKEGLPLRLDSSYPRLSRRPFYLRPPESANIYWRYRS